jgi:hypothetical protein
MLMIDDDDGIKMFRVAIIISKLNPLYRGSFPQKSLFVYVYVTIGPLFI